MLRLAIAAACVLVSPPAFADDHTTELMVNPFGPFAGYFSIAGARAVNHNLAVSVELSYVDLDSVDSEQAAVTLPLYFRRVFDGPFLEPGVIAREDDGDPTHLEAEVMVGWSWMAASGWHVAAAIGASYVGQYLPIKPAGYVRIGYAF